MNRYLTLLGVICAALALIFQLVSFAAAAIVILIAAGVILAPCPTSGRPGFPVGNLTGL